MNLTVSSKAYGSSGIFIAAVIDLNVLSFDVFDVPERSTPDERSCIILFASKNNNVHGQYSFLDWWGLNKGWLLAYKQALKAKAAQE